MKNGLPFSILVIDDDADDRMFIDEAFQEIGYQTEVKKFINADALLRYLNTIDPDLYPSLIVLDNTLEELEAADVLSMLKTNPSYKDIPVVVYATLVSPSKKQQLLSLGAFACYEKGSTMQEVITLATELKELAESKVRKLE